MAEIITNSIGKSKRSVQKHLSVDMTPMVDLGFLLITFFIFTTSIAESKSMKLIMPADGISMDLAESAWLTVLIGDENKLHYYRGRWEEAREQNKIYETSYHTLSGIGSVIRKMKSSMGERDSLMMLIIKPGDHSTYQNLTNILDEVLINDLKKYAIVDATEPEKAFMQQLQINNKKY